MAEKVVKVENGTTNLAPIFTSLAPNPAVAGVYLHSIAAVVGTVAAQNFISLMNPADSGRRIVLGEAAISSESTAQNTVLNPLRGWRISDSAGGTLIPQGDIVKLDTAVHPTPFGVVRVDNPTATLVAPVFNSPAPVTNQASFVHSVSVESPASFVLNPGEGVLLRRESGVVTIGWNITIVWAELF